MEGDWKRQGKVAMGRGRGNGMGMETLLKGKEEERVLTREGRKEGGETTRGRGEKLRVIEDG